MTGTPPPPPLIPPPPPPAKPSGGFPWVACAVIGGVGFVLLIIPIILALGWLVFFKPKPHPAPMPP